MQLEGRAMDRAPTLAFHMEGWAPRGPRLPWAGVWLSRRPTRAGRGGRGCRCSDMDPRPGLGPSAGARRAAARMDSPSPLWLGCTAGL
eukprot:8058479-Alexandrium_andersonii.AAC.1